MVLTQAEKQAIEKYMERYYLIHNSTVLLKTDIRINQDFWKQIEADLKIERNRIKTFVWRTYLSQNDVYLK